MRPDDFFKSEGVYEDNNGWVTEFKEARSFREDLLEQARRGPVPEHDDVTLALGLATLIHEELERYGTDSSQQLTEAQLALGVRALGSVTKRLAVDFDLPFRNFSGFKTYWLSHDGYGSWQARRVLLNDLFEPLHVRLMRLEEAMLEALAEPVSPRTAVGWPLVDEEVRELRRRFRTASTPQDYRDVGTHCVGVLEALGRTVYDAAKHLREGETVPPPDKTKQRLGRYIEDSLPGGSNEELRGLATKTIELAHQVKHRPTPTRREAGIAADAVILLSNMLRRLDQEF
jgi:hypothetical protein